MTKKILRVLAGERIDPPPIWLMRQAGRYLPEYRQLRAQASTFLELCYSPKLAAEVTLQPIRRFGLDAAILFSDILVVADALGQPVSFEGGGGPKLDPVDASLRRIREQADMTRLAPVLETVGLTRAALPDDVALIGFCGGPWTVATYMVAGCGGLDQQPARLFAYRDPTAFGELIDRLVQASIDYLNAQIEAGAEAVQIFESWAGALPDAELDRWCVRPLTQIVQGVKSKAPDIPVIVFPRGSGSRLPRFAQITGVDALGLDTSADPAWAKTTTASRLALQGNLDPMALVVGGAALDAGIEFVLKACAGRPHIFNLGHGIVPETPIAHVERLVSRVRKR